VERRGSVRNNGETSVQKRNKQGSFRKVSAGDSRNHQRGFALGKGGSWEKPGGVNPPHKKTKKKSTMRPRCGKTVECKTAGEGPEKK